MVLCVRQAIFVFFTCFSFCMSATEQDVSKAVLKPVRLVLDFGPWKTGSSTLCAHLERDQAALRKHGVMYAPRLDRYRWAQGIGMRTGMCPNDYPKDYFLQIAAEARKRRCHTVIFINENFFNGGHCLPPNRDVNQQTNLKERPNQVESLYKLLTDAFSEVSLSCRVREIYSWVYSIYWQNRMHGMFFSDLKTFSESLDTYSARIDWPVTLSQGPFSCHMNVLNFHESCEKGLYLAFLQAHGLKELAPHLNMHPIHENSGVTLSAANILEGLRITSQHLGLPGSDMLDEQVFPRRESGDQSFYYYDEAAAKVMYEKTRPSIHALNDLIKGRKLLTEPHLPSAKYVATWPQDYVHPADLVTLLEKIQKHGLHPKRPNAH